MSNAPDTFSPARRAVSLAATVCRHVQRELNALRAITKDDKSPVTVADFASQAVVAHTLREALGDLRMVGEEDSSFLRDPAHAAHLAATIDAVRRVWSGATEFDVLDAIDLGNAQPTGNFWTLDPIDGTKGFLRGQQYAVSLALIEDGQVTLGALACPNMAISHEAPLDEADPAGSLYLAQRARGAFEAPLDDPDAEPAKILRDDPAPDAPIRVCASVETANTSVSDTDRILEHIGRGSKLVRLDSQAKYAVVARDQADAYLRLPTRKGYIERIWDHAAGSLVATETGCRVSDIHGKSLDFSRGEGLEANRGVICASPAIHEAILVAIRELGLAPEPA